MKNQKQDLIDQEAVRERTACENDRLTRDQKVQEKDTAPRNFPPDQNAARLNEQEKEDEMEELYREEENRGTVEKP